MKGTILNYVEVENCSNCTRRISKEVPRARARSVTPEARSVRNSAVTPFSPPSAAHRRATTPLTPQFLLFFLRRVSSSNCSTD